MIVATGFRPDFSFLSDIRLTLDPWLESSGEIGPLIDLNRHSCATVRPHGAQELAHVESGFLITPHIAVWEKAKRDDGTFSRSDFTFDKEKNEYTCPNGKALRTTGKVHDGRTILYRASKFDCDPCPLKPKCCPNVPWRKVPRDVNEEARDIARALMGTPAFETSRDERKRVEMRFAHLKTHHRFERLRLRGLTGARDEFHLAAIVQNLKTLAKHTWAPGIKSPQAVSGREG